MAAEQSPHKRATTRHGSPALDSKELSSGPPPITNPRGLRDDIDALIARASTWERIYLRQRARTASFDTSSLAGISHLPPELLVEVVRLLTIGDLFNCCMVSKQWRNIWVGEPLREFCQIYLPGFIEANCYSPLTLDEAFLKQVGHRKRMLRPSPATVFIPWDISPGLEAERKDSFSLLTAVKPMAMRHEDSPGFGAEYVQAFGEGKLAWQADKTTVLIDDLRSWHRELIHFGSERMQGNEVILEAITSNMMVLGIGKREGGRVCANSILIQFMSNNTRKTLRLPTRLERCYASKDSLVAVCSQGQVMFWSATTPARIIDTGVIEEIRTNDGEKPADGQLMGPPSVMFHPYASDIFFLAWLYHHEEPPLARTDHPAGTDSEDGSIYGGKRPLKYELLVRKYESGELEVEIWEPVCTRRKFDPPCVLGHPHMRELIGDFKCQPVDAHGTYSVVCIHPEVQASSAGEDLYPGCAMAHDDEWTVYCFNVLTLSWTKNVYGSSIKTYNGFWAGRDGSSSKAVPALWNDRLHVPRGTTSRVLRMEIDSHPKQYEDGREARHCNISDHAACIIQPARSENWSGMLEVEPSAALMDEGVFILTSKHGYRFCAFEKDKVLPPESAISQWNQGDFNDPSNISSFEPALVASGRDILTFCDEYDSETDSEL